MTTIRLKVSELVFDPAIYPRGSIDRSHVEVMRQAFHAGAKFPPFVIDEASRKLTDGVHRREVYQAEELQDLEVDCIAKHYANEGAMFLDAMRLNAAHGLPLSPFDRARAASKCRQFGLGALAIAEALGMTLAKLRAIGEGRTAMVAPSFDGSDAAERTKSRPRGMKQQPREIVLKRSVEHLRGQEVTVQQEKTIQRLSDRKQLETVEELIVLLESGLIDLADPVLATRLRYASELLVAFCARSPVAIETPEPLAVAQEENM